MAISIDWNTRIIFVPQADLTFVSGTLYSHDSDVFRLQVKTILASEEGMPFVDTDIHNTEVGPIVGVTYARSIEYVAPYSIEYEDGQYTVTLEGSNNNMFDVAAGILVQNQVQILGNNSAGLIVVPGGGGGPFTSDRVYVDTDALSNGDGTAGDPFDNIGDTVDYAEANGIKIIVTYAEITLDRNLKNFVVMGTGHPVINCAGYDLKNTEFIHCTLRGTYLDSIIATSSTLDDGFSLNGDFENCGLGGDLTCIDGGDVVLANCWSVMPGLARPTISLNGAGSSSLSIRSLSAGLTILDVNNVLDVVTVEMSQGKLTLDSTCTAGVISVRGISQFTDNSNGSTVDISGLFQPQNMAEALAWSRKSSDNAEQVNQKID